MAQRFYKVRLRESAFPMLSEQQTRTHIATSAGKAAPALESPGIAYCHNVMPSAYGYDSVGFSSVVSAAAVPAGLAFSDVRVIHGDNRTRIYLAWDTNGNLYSLLPSSTAWLPLLDTSPVTAGAGFSSDSVTIGTVNGVSYILYSTTAAFIYNETTNKLDQVVLSGLDINTVLGVVASSGYLIAYTKTAVAWSSTLLPTDFVPSTVTGAGGGNVAGIAGSILFATSNTLGILIYTDANTIAGTFTGNVQFPFKFREVENSKGGVNLDRIAYEANSSKQFIFSKAGLQSIDSRRAEAILPEVTDFLAGRRFEDYNEVTKLYEVTDLAPTATMQKKIKYIASRYLVISYGLTSFTHALVFDNALQKLGKLKISHADCFEYIDSQSEIAKESLAFVANDGSVQVVDFSTAAASSGVIILGKLQFSANRFITLLGVELENIDTVSDTLSVDSQVSLDGKNFTLTSGTSSEEADNFREYKFRSTAKNHSIVLAGKFNLVTVQVRYTLAGRR